MRLAAVVPCTDSKAGTGHALELGTLDASLPVAEFAGRWMENVVAASHDLLARDLYKGPGWVASLRMIAALQATGAEVVWRIVSAGYGLLGPEEPVARYSATFLAGHSDSVPGSVRDGDAGRAWWTLVNQFRGQPEPLVRLASEVNGLVVAASAPYVDAVAEELVEVAHEVPAVVFCAGRPRNPEVAALAPRFDRRLREGPDAFVSGGDVGFNQRVATRCVELLGAGVVDRVRVDEVLAAAMDREGPVRHGRQGASDAAVMAFIDATLTSDPSASRTALLRRWRDAGRACEQGRFGALYERVVAERDGQLTLGEAACG